MDTKSSKSNLLIVYLLYEQYIRQTCLPAHAQQILNILRSALFRIVLRGFGFQRLDPQRKMSQSETDAAQEFLETLPVRHLLQVHEKLHQGFEQLNTPQTSRHTYGAAVEKLLTWSELQEWYPNARRERLQDQCCPPMRRGRGAVGSLKLTSRTGIYRKYALTLEELPASLRAEIEDLVRLLTASFYPGRLGKPLKASSAKAYIREILRMLGFLVGHALPSIRLEDLSLADLVPYLPEEEWEGLGRQQQRKQWKPLKEALERFLYQYFEFISEFSESSSPSTRANKVTALISVLKWVYRRDLESEEDLKSNPLYQLLSKHLKTAMNTKQKWQKSRTHASDETKKFPDSVPGQTMLATIFSEVLEPLRLECRPRDQWGQLRGSHAIAKSLQRFLQWGSMVIYPARRQEEPCSLKLALSCPLPKPEGIPEGGWILPLPAPHQRERDAEGVLIDNYLFRTYHHQGEDYPEGVYVLDIQGYKTEDTHGPQSIVIPNRSFAEQLGFYNYLDQFLLGQWLPRASHPEFPWWGSELRTSPGRWTSLGRMDFRPNNYQFPGHKPAEATHDWSYLFLQPDVGNRFGDSEYSLSFEVPAYRLIGKRTSPHTMRYIWATWGFQVGLNDRELEALAYCMGHTVAVLRALYERCTAQEKRQPVEQAISRLLFTDFTAATSDKPPLDLPTLIDAAQQLSAEERQRLIETLVN